MHSLEIIDLIVDTIIIYASKIRGFKLSLFSDGLIFCHNILAISDNHRQKSILKHANSVQNLMSLNPRIYSNVTVGWFVVNPWTDVIRDTKL